MEPISNELWAFYWLAAKIEEAKKVICSLKVVRTNLKSSIPIPSMYVLLPLVFTYSACSFVITVGHLQSYSSVLNRNHPNFHILTACIMKN